MGSSRREAIPIRIPSSSENGRGRSRGRSKNDWMRKEGVLYWHSLHQTQKQDFLAVSARDLLLFSQRHVQDPWLANFLQDAIAFFQLHRTWTVFLCPDLACSRLFTDYSSLILHLKSRRHFPHFYSAASACPPPRPCRFADSLYHMVWKPIDAPTALDLLSTMCLRPKPASTAHMCASPSWLNSFNWVFLDNHEERKALLLELRKGLQVLLAKQERASISLISDDLFLTMTALASRHLFLDCPTTYNNLSFFQSLLAHSPLSFCLLEARFLSCFVETVKLMCQPPVRQDTTSCSTDPQLHSALLDISWNTSQILDVLSASLGAVSVKIGSPSDDEWHSLLNSLCRVPRLPLIQEFPNKAARIFSYMHKIMERLCPDQHLSSNPSSIKHLQSEPYCCSEDPNKLESSESLLKWELHRIQLANEVQHLESQLHHLCAVNCHPHILLLIGSFLGLKLDVRLRCHELRVQEGNPVAQTISYQEENIERNFSSDGSETEYDSDYSYSDIDSDETGSEDDSESTWDCNKPWKNDPVVHRLDSTLSNSATGGTDGAGPFFWMSISDVQRHCKQHFGNAEFKGVIEGISWFRVNKTWKYWVCYCCDETFTDWETHMMHLEETHRLCLGFDDCWLIPQKNSQNVVELRKYVVKRELELENSITLDQTSSFFLVDSAMFDQMPPTLEAEESVAKSREFMKNIHSELCDLSPIFDKKHEYLTYLEVVNSLEVMYGQPVAVLGRCLDKLSFNDCLTDTTCQLKLQSICELCYETHPSCKGNVQMAIGDMRDDLISKIDFQDQKILEALVRIDDLKRNLSEHSVCDYRTKIMPSVRSFLHAKFKLNYTRSFFGCNKIKDMLASTDYKIPFEDSFHVVVQSPGKVIINTKKSKSLWGFACVGISLKFFAKRKKVSCPEIREEVEGELKFGGWYTWGVSQCMSFENVVSDNKEAFVWNLKHYISRAVSYKFMFLQQKYVEEINGDVGIVTSGE